jgi:hypothetical protein
LRLKLYLDTSVLGALADPGPEDRLTATQTCGKDCHWWISFRLGRLAMKKQRIEEGPWETPSLEWIHRIRRERQLERAGQPPRPIAKKESEKLVKEYGLKLARAATGGR